MPAASRPSIPAVARGSLAIDDSRAYGQSGSGYLDGSGNSFSGNNPPVVNKLRRSFVRKRQMDFNRPENKWLTIGYTGPHSLFVILSVVLVIISCLMFWSAIHFTTSSSFFNDLQGLYISSSTAMTIFAGIAGILTGMVMFFKAVKPLSQRRSVTGDRSSQEVVLLLGIVALSCGSAAFLFSFRLQDQVSQKPGNAEDPTVKELMLDSLRNRYTEQFSWHQDSKFWDRMQFQLRCCGVKGPDDWRNSKFFNVTNTLWPMSCCTQLPLFFKSTDGETVSDRPLDNPDAKVSSIAYENAVYGTYNFTLVQMPQIAKWLNYSCYRQQKLVNDEGCKPALLKYYSFISKLYMSLDAIHAIVAFCLVLLVPIIF